MEKKRVRAQVINGDLEIKKYKIRKQIKEIQKYVKDNAESYAKCLVLGAGIAVVFIIKNEL